MPRPLKLPPIETASDRNERAFRGFAPLYTWTRSRPVQLRPERGWQRIRSPPDAPPFAAAACDWDDDPLSQPESHPARRVVAPVLLAFAGPITCLGKSGRSGVAPPVMPGATPTKPAVLRRNGCSSVTPTARVAPGEFVPPGRVSASQFLRSPAAPARRGLPGGRLRRPVEGARTDKRSRLVVGAAPLALTCRQPVQVRYSSTVRDARLSGLRLAPRQLR